MVNIDIKLELIKETFTGDGTSTFSIPYEASDIEVIVSGIYFTEGQDYSISLNSGTNQTDIIFVESPLQDENINIKYFI